MSARSQIAYLLDIHGPLPLDGCLGGATFERERVPKGPFETPFRRTVYVAVGANASSARMRTAGQQCVQWTVGSLAPWDYGGERVMVTQRVESAQQPQAGRREMH